MSDPAPLVTSLISFYLATYVLTFAIALSIATLFALLIREIVCWYWKVNDIVKILKNIEKNTSNINNLNKSTDEPSGTSKTINQ